MKQLSVEPCDWPCTLSECAAGLFVFEDILCVKLEDRNEDGYVIAYEETGEPFQGDATDHESRENLLVQPVLALWR